MKHIFLDCDGVLADFDTLAIELYGMHPREAEPLIGTDEFLRKLRDHGSFYRDLPLLPDARELYEGVAHLGPTILTGCPEGGWAERHFPGVPIITCLSREKYLHLRNPGDILVDDYLKYRELWVEAGGAFVHHTSAENSLGQLAALGVDVQKS